MYTLKAVMAEKVLTIGGGLSNFLRILDLAVEAELGASVGFEAFVYA